MGLGVAVVLVGVGVEFIVTNTEAAGDLQPDTV
mgnify:CR=1 FL=1